jgi:hypothetical protein
MQTKQVCFLFYLFIYLFLFTRISQKKTYLYNPRAVHGHHKTTGGRDEED